MTKTLILTIQIISNNYNNSNNSNNSNDSKRKEEPIQLLKMVPINLICDIINVSLSLIR
ncbi:hypothetical protein RhiirA1_455754 [Rhizophagus irregularis]|uniref:Uncharacterized protein n=1 Tax=Rhizophagus irregularis TaxID=588596 RepID=A0A2N0S264_9GLOM|nr:hypothetical protein RhiirA1_455754 [Rhizophagus irregularis]